MLMSARDPCMASDFWDDRRHVAYGGGFHNAPMELRVYDRAGGKGFTDQHFTPLMKERHACRGCSARRGSVDFAWLNGDGCGCGQVPADPGDWSSKEAE